MASYESYPEPPAPKETKHRGLKVGLAIAIVVLLVIAGTIGVMVWRNSAQTTAYQTDTEALNQGSAGVDDTKFHKVKLKGLPAYSDIYGKKLGGIKNIQGSMLAFDGTGLTATKKAPACTSVSVAKKVRYQATASLKGASGVTVDVYFDKNKKAVALEYAFDLDALGVPEAEFAIFADSRVVPESLLAAVGVKQSIIDAEDLTRSEAPGSLTEEDGMRSCTFSGTTGEKLKTVTKIKKVKKTIKKGPKKGKKKVVKKKIKKKVQVNFMDWQLVQAYIHESSDEDSALTRTSTITLW